MSSNIGQELLRIKAKLERDRATKLELQGELKSKIRQLKNDFGVSTSEEAEGLQSSLNEQIKDLEKQIETLIGKIREAMEGSGDAE